MFSICNKHEAHISTAFCPLCHINVLQFERDEALRILGAKIEEIEQLTAAISAVDAEYEAYLERSGNKRKGVMVLVEKVLKGVKR